MSNYSKVMVCWTSIDGEVESASKRVTDIIEGYHARAGGYPPQFMISGGAGDDVPGATWACETVVVASIGYFEAEEMLALLRSMAWEKPSQVELFWKDEEMESFERRGIT